MLLINWLIDWQRNDIIEKVIKPVVEPEMIDIDTKFIINPTGKFVIAGAMIGGIVAIALHCMVIVGKEEDSKWEEEQITRNEEKQRALIKVDEEHQPWQLQNVGARIRETKIL